MHEKTAKVHIRGAPLMEPPRPMSFLCSCAAHCLFKEGCRLPAAGDAGCPPPRGDSFCAAVQHVTLF
ncbi:hypothetical protein D7Y41_32000 [Anaerotruncus sp. 1XD22-93]|nr:hypothetical protein D7Y41_32000 [Anaerotruncus sp. 1XD22-93]